MLEINGINVYYGAIHALKELSLQVEAGSIVTLIGANGAGKTTTLKTISGILRAKSGTIAFEGQEIQKLPPEKVVQLGIAHVPEGRRIFSSMTVLENLELGAYLRRDKPEIAADLQSVYERFPRLREREKQLAGTLSGGEQQMLAIGRALMARPKLLLMDEPSMGLAPLLVKEIFSIIQDVNAQGSTILLVEQNAKMALSIAHYAYVIETGQLVLSGPAQELADSDEIRKAYLGG
jgi:branched-chain amino acid transport system ATP-binding protein